ncbi:MAG: hypothetical protein LC119_05780 [Burkholderiales bacterium]|nr:hypothetical protein [Burkholderiales bacterium]
MRRLTRRQRVLRGALRGALRGQRTLRRRASIIGIDWFATAGITVTVHASPPLYAPVLGASRRCYGPRQGVLRVDGEVLGNVTFTMESE